MENTETLATSPLAAAQPRRLNLNLENLLAVLIIGLAFVSRFYDLGARIMSHDEVNHVVPAYDFFQGRGYRYDPVTHGPLQFHLMALSYALFGDNDFTARIPAALFSIGTVAFAVLAYRRYLGRWGTLATGGMLLISPYLLFYGRYARNEAFIVFWAVVTLYAILRYLERGERWALLLFVIINALHFTDKSTAFIFAAEQLMFLGGLLLIRLLRQRWPAPNDRQRFWLSLGAAAVFGAVTAGVYLVEKPLVAWHILPGALLAAAGGVAALIIAVRGLGWELIRRERAFDLLVVLLSLILPLLAALPIKIAGANPTDYSTPGLLRAAAVIVPLAGVALALGLWWNRRLWLVCAALFYTPWVLLYSTFFTNALGIAGGFMGALGYWMEQQAVSRGSQPWYYYIFVQIPIYEFLPALGTLLAIFLGSTRRLWVTRPCQPFVPGPFKDDAGPEQPVPTLALLVFWSVSSVAAFSVAGEKMPWLTAHLTLPLILAAGWAVGYLVETARWSEMRHARGWLILPLLAIFVPALGSIFYTFAALGSAAVPSSLGTVATADTLGRTQSIVMINVSILAVLLSGLGLFVLLKDWAPGQIFRGSGLVALAGLAVLTARTSFRAAYINYDYAVEYMVYAHGAPAPKRIFNDLEALARRAPDGQGPVIAYDNFVRYPYWWYLRAYANKIDFDVNPTNDIRRAAVIMVGEENNSKVVPIVRKDYVEFTHMRMWWPNQDYWRLKWDEIAAERRTALGASADALAPMSLGEYLSRVWQHLSPFFTDPRVRSAVFKIWLDRDYRAYAALQNSTSFTLDNWSPADRMHVYVRKDIAAQVWTLGARPAIPAADTSGSDAYDQAYAQRNPDQTFGASGAAPGQFQTPRGVAFAGDGSVYVADAGNHRIQHLQATGDVLQVWGSFADAAKSAAPGGTFNEPWGVAVGPDGAVYVADTWNHRVQKFTADGQFVKMWNGWQLSDRTETFWGPRGIAVDASGRVYVTDTGNKRVVVFDADGNYVTQFGGAGSEPGQLEEPVGVAIDPQGRVVVADTWNQRVQVFAPDATGLTFTPAASWAVAAWYSQSLENKPFIAVAESGDVVLTDPEGCRVLEFSPAGQIAHIWGQCSSGIDGFGQPSGIAADRAGGVWISDATNQRLLHFPKP
jgi:DNA-binding beta-propeller fold protein YncE